MNSTTAADQVQALLRQQTELLASKARLLAQLDTTDKQLAAIDAAVQGVQLGQALAAEVAAEEAAKPAAD